MLNSYLSRSIFEKLIYSPTPGQKDMIEKLSCFILENGEEGLFIIKGFAGSGKTYTISALVKALDEVKQSSELLAPTGRAAKVLAGYAGKPAYTIHRKIYRQQSSRDGTGIFVRDKNLYRNTLFIVDEASMISNTSIEKSIFGSGNLLDDLIRYVYEGVGCRLILIGDTAQLPPVGLSLSPALDKKKLEGYGKKVTEVFLSDIVRQAAGSGIVMNATGIRNLISEGMENIPRFKLSGYEDISDLPGNELIESISSSYDRYGVENTTVICRSNKRANQYNAGIRNQILYREEELTTGDLLMVVKNNYFWTSGNKKIDFIANGDIVKVTRIKRTEELYGYRFADAVIELPDYAVEMEVKLLTNTLTVDAAALSMDDNRKLFYSILEDYRDISPRREQYEKVRLTPHFNALQVKYAYAVTCHKAQGGQWDCAYIDQGYIPPGQINIDYLRWLYTAVTRASEKLFLVNFPREYFGNSI